MVRRLSALWFEFFSLPKNGSNEYRMSDADSNCKGVLDPTKLGKLVRWKVGEGRGGEAWRLWTAHEMAHSDRSTKVVAGQREVRIGRSANQHKTPTRVHGQRTTAAFPQTRPAPVPNALACHACINQHILNIFVQYIRRLLLLPLRPAQQNQALCSELVTFPASKLLPDLLARVPPNTRAWNPPDYSTCECAVAKHSSRPCD